MNSEEDWIGKKFTRACGQAIEAVEVIEVKKVIQGDVCFYDWTGCSLVNGSASYMGSTLNLKAPSATWMPLTYENIRKAQLQAHSCINGIAKHVYATYGQETARDDRHQLAAIQMEVTGREYDVAEIIEA